MNANTDTDDLLLRRQLWGSLGYTLREDVCSMFKVSPATEEAWRKRGRPPAEYVRAGNEIVYSTQGLAERLKADLRRGSCRSAAAASL